MKKINVLFGFLFSCVLLILSFLCVGDSEVFADEGSYTADDIYEVCEGIVDWAALEGDFFSEDLVSAAGSSASDWLFIGYCRLIDEVDADGVNDYLQALEEYVTEIYETGNLENTKATEWQRVGLAVLAAGADPTDFGLDADGNSVDIVAEGTYDHAKYSSLGRQGVNGWCFALILMDASEVEVPEDATYTREYIIKEILAAQLENGGFSLTGAADPDVTSIAIQALAPYYGGGTVYTFESDEETVSKTVGEAVDLALSWLSSAQLEDGDFQSYGTANAESTAQVLLALSCLGIDPQTDERFIKEGNTVIDGLLKYRTEEGGFAHVLDDEGNATVINGLSSAQALCGLTAYFRQLSGTPGFYEFTEDESEGIETEESEETESTETEVENEQPEAAWETDSQVQDDDMDSSEDTENVETSSETDDDENELPAGFVYAISAIIICIGVIAFIVMKKIGVEDEKNKSE